MHASLSAPLAPNNWYVYSEQWGKCLSLVTMCTQPSPDHSMVWGSVFLAALFIAPRLATCNTQNQMKTPQPDTAKQDMQLRKAQ